MLFIDRTAAALLLADKLEALKERMRWYWQFRAVVYRWDASLPMR